MSDGINQMVQETMMNYSENFETQNTINEEDLLVSTTVFPPRPGILFYTRQTPTSRYIRPLISSNIKRSFLDILRSGNEDDEFYQNRDYLRGHAVEYPELAEVIADHFGNKHFPLFPDELNHLSGKDPSWWLHEGENTLTLSFKTHSLNGKNEGCKIGPIGDLNIALKRFPILSKKLSPVLPLADFTLDDKSIQFEFKEETDLMKDFKALLLLGNLSENLHDAFKRTLSHTYYYYLLELRGLRRFWIEFEQKNYPKLTQ